MRLYYKKPADNYNEVLPIGNGIMGGMIFGGTDREKISLNECSVWSGYERNRNIEVDKSVLDEARRLIFAGEYVIADTFVAENFLGEFSESFLPVGDVLVDFHGISNVRGYERELDIEASKVQISFDSDGGSNKREYFASYPDRLIAARYQSDTKKDIIIDYKSKIRYKKDIKDNKMIVHCECPEHVDPDYVKSDNPVIYGRGKKFDVVIEVIRTDGNVESDEDTLKITSASSTELLIMIDNIRECNDSFDELYKRHREDYDELYKRVELELGEDINLPTDERLRRLRRGEEDNQLYALFFQYGRYLLISSSREGGMPANLQGLWNWHLFAPWSSNYTTNINLQMNYWPAQICNLRECLSPYYDFMRRLCENGKSTAKDFFSCEGFCLGHNTDYFAATNPTGKPYGKDTPNEDCVKYAFFVLGGAWMCEELFKEYEYNRDIDFLKNTAYVIMTEAVRFVSDYMVMHDGYLVTCPSSSPENVFVSPLGDGDAALSYGSTFDMSIIRELYSNYIKTCEILDIEDELIDRVKKEYELLLPYKIGKDGTINEWAIEFEERELGHRHISHLYGIFPSEILRSDDKAMEAAKKTIEKRLKNGGGHTGWSLAWIINMYAIFRDGEKAYEHLKTLLVRSVYDNMWDAHPPFQIDGNFGGCAAIANMLVQEKDGQVMLLPALPAQWKDGYVKGLRLKNGKSICIKWRNGEVENSQIY